MNSRFLLALWIGASLPVIVQAQSFNQLPPSLVAGAGAFHPEHLDVFAFNMNPATLAIMKKPAIGLTAIRPYGLTQLGMYQFTGNFPVSSGCFGYNGFYDGFSGFSNSGVRFGYGRKAGEKLSAGLSFSLQQVKIAGYGATSFIGSAAGVLLTVTRQLCMSLAVTNPVTTGYEKSGEKMPVQLDIGFGYTPSPVLCLNAVVHKTAGDPAVISAALLYKPVSKIILQAGVGSVTAPFYAGASFELGQFRLGLLGTFHQQLGFTPVLQLLIHAKKTGYALPE